PSLLVLSHHAPPTPLPSFPTRRSSDLAGCSRLSSPPPHGGARTVHWVGNTESCRIFSHYKGSTFPKSLDPYHGETAETCCCPGRSEEHTSELQSRFDLVCRLLLVKKNV